MHQLAPSKALSLRKITWDSKFYDMRNLKLLAFSIISLYFFFSVSADCEQSKTKTRSNITFFPTPNLSMQFDGKLVSGAGRLWLANSKGKVGLIAPNGTIKEFLLPNAKFVTGSDDPYAKLELVSATVDTEGNFWLSLYDEAYLEDFGQELGYNIVRVTPNGTITTFLVSHGSALAADSHSGVLVIPRLFDFATALPFKLNSLGEVSPLINNLSTTISLDPVLITDALVDNAGNSWLALLDRRAAFFISRSGSMQEVSLANLDFWVPTVPELERGWRFLVVGPDDNIWFMDRGTDCFGRVNANLTIRKLCLAENGMDLPMFLGPDRNIWAIDGHVLIRVSPSLRFTLDALPDIKADGEDVDISPYQTALGPDGKVWMTAKIFRDISGELIGDGLIRLDRPPKVPSIYAVPRSGTTPSTSKVSFKIRGKRLAVLQRFSVFLYASSDSKFDASDTLFSRNREDLFQGKPEIRPVYRIPRQHRNKAIFACVDCNQDASVKELARRTIRVR